MTKQVISLLLVALCATSTLQQGPDYDGYPSEVGVFPWYAFIQQETFFSQHCGGTIIAPRWILTSATCKHFNDDSVYTVFVGGVDWQYESDSEQILQTNVFHRHPLFIDDREGNRTNNVGLLELPTEIQFSENVQPISLPWTFSADSFDGQDLHIVAIVVLFGPLGPMPTLRFNQVRVLSDDECDDISPGLRNSAEMCTFISELNPLHTPCTTEAGPALAILDNGNWTLVGAGAEKRCGNIVPSRWNRVTEHLSWISEMTGLTEN